MRHLSAPFNTKRYRGYKKRVGHPDALSLRNDEAALGHQRRFRYALSMWLCLRSLPKSAAQRGSKRAHSRKSGVLLNHLTGTDKKRLRHFQAEVNFAALRLGVILSPGWLQPRGGSCDAHETELVRYDRRH